jgi:hypothetical protein
MREKRGCPREILFILRLGSVRQAISHDVPSLQDRELVEIEVL